MLRNQVCLRKYRQMSQIQLMLWIQVRLKSAAKILRLRCV